MPPRVPRALVAIILGTGLLLSSRASFADEPGALPWRDDFAHAQEEARSRNRPLWVQFTGPWCGYCRQMERETFVSPDIVALARARFIPVRVQSDIREDLALRFGLSGLPATYLVAPSGEVLAQQEGYADPRSFRAFLDQALARLARSDPRGEAGEMGPRPPAVPSASIPRAVTVALTGRCPMAPGAEVRAEGGAPEEEALAGLCPVTLIQEHRLVPGQRALALRLEGREYWFATHAHREAFLKQPEAFLPADGGRCIVSRLDAGRSLPGQSRYGVLYQDRIYLCADAAALERFTRDPERYSNADVAEQGFCPHCRNQSGRRVRGSPLVAARHAGQRYFFPDSEHRAAFRAAPERYLR